MSPNETRVLRIAEARGILNNIGQLSRIMGISTNYVTNICDSLIRNGYLMRTTSRGYELAPKGKEVILGLLYEDKGRIEARIKRLRQLEEKVNEKIGKLEI